MTLTIKEPNEEEKTYTDITNTADNKYNILKLFDIKIDSGGQLKPLTNIKSISSLNFNSTQYIDLSRLFEVLPNYFLLVYRLFFLSILIIS